MGRVLTNNFSLAYAVQSAFDVFTTVAGDWKLTEPNGVSTFGADITTVARAPISKNRQARKGTTTDLDANVEYEADLTRDSFIDFIEGFCFVTATNGDTVFPPRPGNRAAAEGNATATGFTIPSATAAQAAKFQFTAAGPISLVFGRGYTLAANNGLKPLDADLTATQTELSVSGTSVETAPANAEVSMAGIRAEAGDLALAVSAGVGTLTSGNGASVTPIDFTTLGWTVGQVIHMGGLTSANQFGSTAAADGTRSLGYARLLTIAAGTATFDKLDTLLVASDGTDDGSAGTEIPMDLLYGRYIRNVPTDDSEFLEKIFLFEGEWPNLFETTPPTPVANPDGFEYLKNSYCNQLTWNLPLTDKSTATFAFVSTDADPPVDNASRRTGASTAADALQTTAFNTTADFIRLRVQDTDETGLTTDFKNLTVTLNNNVSPEKVLGTLGARFVNFGNFDVSIEGNILFTSGLVIDRIRNNTTVTMDYILTNEDGAIAVDIPSLILSGGARELPINESVQASLTGTAFQDMTFSTSLGVSLLPSVP